MVPFDLIIQISGKDVRLYNIIILYFTLNQFLVLACSIKNKDNLDLPYIYIFNVFFEIVKYITVI
jgi:hypothetical protein